MFNSGSGKYSGPKEIKYLFIDGGYLNKVVESISKRFFDEHSINLDFEKLSSGFSKTFYYDCPPAQTKSETDDAFEERNRKFKSNIQTIKNTRGHHVFLGSTVGNPGRTRQKQIDVKISVDMLLHTIRNNMHEATLIAGDLDFKPLVDALIIEGMFIDIWCAKGQTSQDLTYSADSRKFLNIATLHDSLPPEIQLKYPRPTGFIGPLKTEGYLESKTGKDKEGNIYSLYKGDSNFLILSNTEQENYYHHRFHKNLDFMLKYLEDTEDLFINFD